MTTVDLSVTRTVTWIFVFFDNGIIGPAGMHGMWLQTREEKGAYYGKDRGWLNVG